MTRSFSHLAHQEEDLIAQGIGESHAAKPQRTHPAGDLLCPHGGEDLFELFDFSGSVTVGSTVTIGVKFFVVVVFRFIVNSIQEALLLADLVHAAASFGTRLCGSSIFCLASLLQNKTESQGEQSKEKEGKEEDEHERGINEESRAKERINEGVFYKLRDKERSKESAYEIKST